MKRTYYAKIKYNKKDGVYEATFPEFSTIHTFGTTLKEACEMAKDALESYIPVSKTSFKVLNIPEPSGIIYKKITVEF